MTVAALVMWSVWAALALFLAVLFIYRSSLTRDEEDQIFLDESFDHEKTQQAVITARVARIEPMVRIARWLVVAMTAVVLAYYVRDVMLQLHILE
jgi:Na+/melibiose symporter-like transporter